MPVSNWNKQVIATVAFLLAAVGATGTTGVIVGQGLVAKNFTPGHIPSANQEAVLDIPVLADVTASGSSTVKTTGADGNAGVKYAAACIPNPLRNVGVNSGQTTVGNNSGTVLRLVYHNIANPAGVSGDIGFVNDCNASGSGDTLINNTCTGTGCTSRYTAGTADWHGGHFIKFGIGADPTSSFKARITVRVEDNLGE